MSRVGVALVSRPARQYLYESFGIGLLVRQDVRDKRLDFVRYCDEHRWASEPAPAPEDTQRCPHCAVRMTEVVGAERYQALRPVLAGQVVA